MSNRDSPAGLEEIRCCVFWGHVKGPRGRELWVASRIRGKPPVSNSRSWGLESQFKDVNSANILSELEGGVFPSWDSRWDHRPALNWRLVRCWAEGPVKLCLESCPQQLWYVYVVSNYHVVAAAAAKSFQSCLTLWHPINSSPPGSPIPGILQARTLEWIAISFSNAWKWKVKVKMLSGVRLLATPWTAAHQAPPSMGLSRQKYWSGVHCLLQLLCWWKLILQDRQII